MTALVLRSGLLTSIQDLGRHGLQHLGIVPCGAMDTVSHRIANALVGNDADCATLECTVLGPDLLFEQEVLIACYGAQFDARCESKALPMNRPVWLPAGSKLKLGAAVRGARTYLAVAGGFQTPLVMSSRSTYMPAGFGGFEGRALRKNDRISLHAAVSDLSQARLSRLSRRGVKSSGALRSVAWSAPSLTLSGAQHAGIRAIAGRNFDQFDAASQVRFFESTWKISSESNRMGYRLLGPELQRTKRTEIISEPTCLGTIQVPNSGEPIVLLADHQTTGGYPKFGEVASVDIPELAQLAPGATFRFVQCDLNAAVQARRAMDHLVASVCQSIAWEF